MKDSKLDKCIFAMMIATAVVLPVYISYFLRWFYGL